VTVLVAVRERAADPALAAKLLGYADDASEPAVGVVAKILADLRKRAVASVTAELGSAAFAANALEGSTWDEETAYSEALKLS
jgi:hypothetical protein